jgi:ABC-type sugar transport system ATPase subunit
VQTPALAVTGLRKAYGQVVALDDVSFKVPPGSVLGLLGPNGSGKTTTVSILSTTLRPDAGLDEADALADHIIILDRGRVVGAVAASLAWSAGILALLAAIAALTYWHMAAPDHLRNRAPRPRCRRQVEIGGVAVGHPQPAQPPGALGDRPRITGQVGFPASGVRRAAA